MATDRKTKIALAGWSFLSGALAATALLVVAGETGGNYMRAQRALDRAEYLSYRDQCEASVERAIDLINKQDKVITGG